MLSLTTESDVLKAVAQAVKGHRLSQGLRQVDLAKQSGLAINTVRGFERTGHIGFLGLAKMLKTLGLADGFIAAIGRVPEQPVSVKSFMTSSGKPRQRAPRPSGNA